MKPRIINLNTAHHTPDDSRDHGAFAPLIRSFGEPSPALPPNGDPPPASPEEQDLVAPWLESRTRNGKIARLPRVQRDLVNRMLFNNIPPKKIVDALNEFSVTVTERNISNWKTRGGYREWCLAQNHAVQLRLHQDNLAALVRKDHPSELPEVGLQAAATQLSQFFLTPHAAQLLASDPDEYARRLSLLARVAGHLKALQKLRDDSDETPDHTSPCAQDEAERARKAFSSKNPKGSKPGAPHRNFLPAS